MNLEYHKKMLDAARAQRINEITEYQVNIDNFRLAVEMIGEDPDLQEFKAQLQNLLASNIVEQKKAKLMYDVVVTRLIEMANA